MNSQEDAKYWVQIAFSHYMQKKFKKAIEAFDQAIELNPNIISPWFGKGEVYRTIHNYDMALEAYDRAIELNPNIIPAWLGKGEIYRTIHNYDMALEAYDRAIELNPQLEPDQIWYDKGTVLYTLKRYEDSLEAFDRAIELNPKDAYYWNGRGNVLNEFQFYEAALSAFNNAIKIDPRGAYSWNGKGNALRHLGQNEEALFAFDRAIELEPKIAFPWYGKGVVLVDLQRYEEALPVYDHAIKLDPTFAYTWNGKGDLLTNLERYEEAISAYDRAIELDPTFAYPWNGEGIAYREIKNYPNSNICFLRAYYLDKKVYFKMSVETHLELLSDYQQPAWLQLLFLYLPYLRKAKSWKKLILESEKLNAESNAIIEILAFNSFKQTSKLRIQAILEYFMGNPFRCQQIIEQIIQRQNERLEDYYYLILAMQAYAEPLIRVKEKILNQLNHSLSKNLSKNHFYWAGQIIYELMPDEIDTALAYFKKAEPYLPSYYMQLAVINSEIRILRQEKDDIEFEVNTSRDNKSIDTLRSDLKEIESEIIQWREEQKQVVYEIYQQEKHIVFGEEWGYIRYLTNDTPILKLGLREMSAVKGDYVGQDTYILDQIGDTKEIRKHFWKTARTLLNYKTCLEIRSGLFALEEYVIEYPDSPIAQYAKHDQLKKKLDSFEAWNILSGKLEDIYQTSETAFHQQIQNIENEPQLKELRELQKAGADILTILIARIERNDYKNHPNPNTLNHILIYLFCIDEIPKKELILLLMYQYVQKFGSSISSGEKWLKNGMSFIVERFIDYFQINAIYKILNSLDILDLNNLIDDFLTKLDLKNSIPDYLTFRAKFDEYISYLMEKMGHDFHHSYPLPKGF